MATPRKPGRRSNGRGTVSVLENGRYQARTPYFQDPANGKLVRRSFTAGTRSAAEARLDAWFREWGGNPAGESLTVSDLLERFLSRYAKRVKSGKSPKTLEQYRWAAEHVKPHLGHIVADKLTVQEVEKFLTGTGKESGKLNRDSSGSARPLSDRSVKALRGVLNQAFTEAVKRREVLWNPVAATDAIHVGESNQEALSSEQASALLEVAGRDEERRFYCLIRLGLDLGLRPGELLGLQWRDWDREAKTLRIERSVTKEGGKPVVGGLKSKSSYATLPLSDELVTVLCEHERWLQTELLAGAVTNPEGWMFPSTRGGYQHPDNMRHCIARLGVKAGIAGLTPVLFRHTAATDLAKEKVDPSHRRLIMRHGSLAVTDQYYTHLSHEDLRADLDRLASRHSQAT
ncbi:MAG: tyrosine-type recombinase/integrase [Acidimicrobiales bacterium]